MLAMRNMHSKGERFGSSKSKSHTFERNIPHDILVESTVTIDTPFFHASKVRTNINVDEIQPKIDKIDETNVFAD
jgi:hypothetical protein